MKIDPVSERYARLLQILSIAGMVMLLTTFILYMLNILPSAVSPGPVSELWNLDSTSFNETTGQTLGWGWVQHLFTGDGLAFASLVFLAISTIFCMLVLIRLYARRRDFVYLSIVIMEAIVLSLAASGVLLA